MELLETKLNKDVFAMLIEAELDSLKNIIRLNTVELQDKAKLSRNDAEKVLDEVAELLIGDKIKQLSSMSSWNRIKTGCKSIDEILNGGIPTNGINEIYGCSGVGKTQFCLQLSIFVQFEKNVGGLERGTVYLCTEDVFPAKRINMLAASLPKRFNQSVTNAYEDNVFVEHIADYEQLRRCIFIHLKNLLDTKPIGLIVIDSIAGAFRSENKSVNYVKRSEEIFEIVQKLRDYSQKYNLAVVCVNQVTDDLSTGKTVPSLGNAWGNLVTSRFEISRYNRESRVRLFQVINAPDLAVKKCRFFITPEGLADND